MRDLLTTVLISGLALAGCASGEDPADDPDGSPSATAEPDPSPTATEDPTPSEDPTASPTDGPTDGPDAIELVDCAADRFTIPYPAGWSTNDPSGLLEACRVFHPTAIDLPEEPRDIGLQWAVVVYIDAVPFDVAAGEDAVSGEVLDQRATTVDGRDAVVREVRSDGVGLVPEGERQYGWVVDLGDETLFANTTTVGDTDYDRDRRVLDRMMEGLTLADVEPLAGPASTDPAQAEHRGEPIVLTDISVEGYAGFDRITLAIGGDGQAGWDVAYEQTPTSQGSGAPVDVAGDAALRVTLTGAALPPDAPVPPYDGPERIQPTDTAVVEELLDDTVFEGRHDLFLGVDRERPFRIGRRDGAVVLEVTTD